MRLLILLLVGLLGEFSLSSCAHDYHNPAVEADAAGGGQMVQTNSGLRMAALPSGSSVAQERTQKAQAFWGGSH